MKRALLRRTEMGDAGTFGMLQLEGAEKPLHTIELPARDNAAGISSIPAGVYRCSWTFSNRFQRMMYQVMDVPDRTGIRFHAANLAGDVDKGFKSELNGCIAPGIKRQDFDGQPGIGASVKALQRLEEWGAGEDFDLAVVDEYLEAGKPETQPVA